MPDILSFDTRWPVIYRYDGSCRIFPNVFSSPNKRFKLYTFCEETALPISDAQITNEEFRKSPCDNKDAWETGNSVFGPNKLGWYQVQRAEATVVAERCFRVQRACDLA